MSLWNWFVRDVPHLMSSLLGECLKVTDHVLLKYRSARAQRWLVLGIAFLTLVALPVPMAWAGFVKTQAYRPHDNYPWSLAVGDFNGDGIADLAVAAAYPGAVLILLGNGDGTFRPADMYVYPAGVSCRSVAVGDFNADGIADLVAIASDNVGEFSGSTLILLLGNGDGTFQYGYDVPAGVGANSVAVADFNGDGVQDIVTANYYFQIFSIRLGNGHIVESDVRVFLGNGDGTFQASTTYDLGSAGSLPSSAALAVGDFNGDGVADLAVATPGDKDAVDVC